jgi:hypothetical protein
LRSERHREWGFVKLVELAQNKDHECGNEPSGSVRGGKFVWLLNDCQLFKGNFNSWNSLIQNEDEYV